MIISVSGGAATGKSTVTKLLAQRLQYKQYDMGEFRREAAKKRGLTIQEYNKLGETDSSTDTECDEYQQKLGETQDNFTIQGRTSFHFIPHSFKVYLKVDPEVAALRKLRDQMAKRTNNEASFSTLEETKQDLINRDESDAKRYLKHYSLDIRDPQHYDAIIDTSSISAEEVVDEILRKMRESGHNI